MRNKIWNVILLFSLYQWLKNEKISFFKTHILEVFLVVHFFWFYHSDHFRLRNTMARQSNAITASMKAVLGGGTPETLWRRVPYREIVLVTAQRLVADTEKLRHRSRQLCSEVPPAILERAYPERDNKEARIWLLPTYKGQISSWICDPYVSQRKRVNTGVETKGNNP